MATATMTREQDQILNEQIFDDLASTDPLRQKQAAESLDDYTRLRVREESFMEKIIPFITVTPDDLERQIDTDKPVYIVDKEPDSPSAISAPFGSLPKNIWLRGNRYPVMVDRILTHRFQKDVMELASWKMDIRQVFSDNMIKDMLAEIDGREMEAVDAGLVGADVVLATSGVAQYKTISGSIDRNSWAEGLKIVPSTPFSIPVKTCLTSHLTIYDLYKLGMDEMGGQLSERVFRDGWVEETLMGRRIIGTTKQTLVPANHVYYFPDEKFFGKAVETEPTTMYIRREAFIVEAFAYRSCGMTIGHTGSYGHAVFV